MQVSSSQNELLKLSMLLLSSEDLLTISGKKQLQTEHYKKFQNAYTVLINKDKQLNCL